MKRFLAMFVVVLTYLSDVAFAVVVAYPLPSTDPISTDFHINANDIAIPVEHYRDRHVATLYADGEVTLKITVNAPISAYSIHPASFSLKGKIDNDTLTVSLSPTIASPSPTYLLIKINDLENLVVLLDPVDPKPIVTGHPGVQDVSASPYSADFTGKTLATTAIQSAIDRASQSTGGIVYVPAGLYRVQTLSLKTGVTLYLAGGAVVQGSELLADFAHDPTYQSSQGKHLPAVVDIHDFKNVTIRGYGRIDAADTKVITADGTQQDVDPRGLYHRVALRAENGTGLTLDGITVQDGAGWSVLLRRIENAQITRLKLLGPMWRGNDGIDLCTCNTVVDKSFVYTGDDNFCTKALLLNYPLHDIHFSNSIGYGISAGVKVGMEVRSPQSDIFFDNIDILHTGRGVVVESEAADNDKEKIAGAIKGIYFTNIRVEEVTGKGGISRNPIQIKSDLPGSISNIFLKQVTINNFGPRPSLISGFNADNPVSNVVFDKLTIGGKLIDSLNAGDFKTSNASDIKFLNSP